MLLSYRESVILIRVLVHKTIESRLRVSDNLKGASFGNLLTVFGNLLTAVPGVRDGLKVLGDAFKGVTDFVGVNTLGITSPMRDYVCAGGHPTSLVPAGQPRRRPHHPLALSTGARRDAGCLRGPLEYRRHVVLIVWR